MENNKAEQFVAYVLGRSAKDNGFAARLRRADNPDTEHQSYAILAKFGIDLEKNHERLPYCLIGSALISAQTEKDGTASLGKALKGCFEDADQGDLRLRRLLACDDVDELCRILRPILSLIRSKSRQSLCYGRLLHDMTGFFFDAKRVKLRWAQDYYGKSDMVDPEIAEKVRVEKANSKETQKNTKTPHTGAMQQGFLLDSEG